ncbi:hypothetical protein IH992_27240 [Candidatus Poribacteria bacterium]|nr:hypothetical protein [Candidatus Poribacteria bacterium]
MAVINIEEIKTQDEVIQAIRKIKDDLAKAFSYDIKKMLAEARIRQKVGNRKVVSPPSRTDV